MKEKFTGEPEKGKKTFQNNTLTADENRNLEVELLWVSTFTFIKIYF